MPSDGTQSSLVLAGSDLGVGAGGSTMKPTPPHPVTYSKSTRAKDCMRR